MVFLQNYRASGIFRINKLFFYRKFGGIVPRYIDRVNGSRSTSPRSLIKWETSADESMAQIKTCEEVSDNLIVVINAGMDGSRRLGRQGRRDHGGAPDPQWRLTGVSHYQRSDSPNSTRPSPTPSWRCGEPTLLTFGGSRATMVAGVGRAARRKVGVDGGRLRGSSG
jgi:hypothetical protein